MLLIPRSKKDSVFRNFDIFHLQNICQFLLLFFSKVQELVRFWEIPQRYRSSSCTQHGISWDTCSVVLELVVYVSRIPKADLTTERMSTTCIYQSHLFQYLWSTLGATQKHQNQPLPMSEPCHTSHCSAYLKCLSEAPSKSCSSTRPYQLHNSSKFPHLRRISDSNALASSQFPL